MTYTEQDLKHVDPIEAVRKMAHTLAGDSPRGPFLTAALVRQLLEASNFPIEISIKDGWYLLSCGRDWLRHLPEGIQEQDCWARMIPVSYAVNSIQYEVVLAALSRGLATATKDGVRWIVPYPAVPVAITEELQLVARQQRQGRLVAYLIE